MGTTSQGPPVFQGARATTDWCPSSEGKRRTVPQRGHDEHLATAGRRTRAEATWDATAGRGKTTRATAQAGSPLASLAVVVAMTKDRRTEGTRATWTRSR